jgi:hypothetical protein
VLKQREDMRKKRKSEGGRGGRKILEEGGENLHASRLHESPWGRSELRLGTRTPAPGNGLHISALPRA